MKIPKKRILIAFGTRPEALKFAPLIATLRKSKDFRVYVCLTGQHRQMLKQVTDFFRIRVDSDLRLMKKNQSLGELSGSVISKFGKVIEKARPDIVFVQGDTATALMVGVACFYLRKPIAHLEAGLRTWNKFQPFPEEMNRTLLSHLADYHFTPTETATKNLLHEGLPKRDVFEIGNTIVDTIQLARKFVKTSYPVFKRVDLKKRILFVTAHRRESLGQGMREIFKGLKKIAQSFEDVEIVYPVHLNPKVQEPAHQILGKTARVHLIRPLSYEETFWIMKKCYLILTDSGGIQEEAPSFKKPVLVLRNVTERGEGISEGIARLVGTDAGRIYRETQKLLNSGEKYRQMQARRNPYGDGKASQRIVRILKRELKKHPFRTVMTPRRFMRNSS